MDRFLIITNREKDADFALTKKIVAYIEEKGKKVILSKVPSIEDMRQVGITEDKNPVFLPEEAECAIVLGGDGTIIRTANDLMTHPVPILGVNMGTLGFLAEIEQHHVWEALDCLFQNNYRIEERIMIEGNIVRQSKQLSCTTDFALNDVVITRKGFSRIISLGIYVNDVLVDNFRGDGVIISTPTGSTAYNLSAGGPIVMAQACVMVITPICPHSLSPRSIIVSAEDTIKVVVGKSKKTQEAEAIVTFDGEKGNDMETNDIVFVNKAKYRTKLIKLSYTGIYEVLRSKLGKDGE